MHFERILMDARDEGLEEGRKEGRDEERCSIALNMLADNEPLDKICKFTKLSIEKIKELAKNKFDSEKTTS